MRTGIAYGFTISIGVLLGYFVTNPFWLIAIPAALTAIVVISVVHTERERAEELQRAQSRVRKILDEQRRHAFRTKFPSDKFRVSDSDYD